jgi:hypothetical protein
MENTAVLEEMHMNKRVFGIVGALLLWWSVLIIGVPEELLSGNWLLEFLVIIFVWPVPTVLLALWLACCFYLWRSSPRGATGSGRNIFRTVSRGVLQAGVVIFGLILVLLFVVVYPPRYEGTYHGQVVEAETGAPIAGAVVLGVWDREYLTVAGGVDRFYKAREVLTDANGNFTLPGMGLLIMSNIVPANIVIFKAGYEYFGPYYWATLIGGPILSKRIRWEGEKAIIPLKKLTLEERKKQSTGLAGSFPQEKQKLLIRELNKERVELGRRPSYKEPK